MDWIGCLIIMKRIKWHRVLPRLEGFVSGRDRHEMELVRLDRAMRSQKQIVLIHTCGKVGSTAIQAALSPLRSVESFQTHFISKLGVLRARQEHAGSGQDPFHLKLGEEIQKQLEKYPERPVKVVTLVREPVARAVSNLFENPLLITGTKNLREISLERLMEYAELQVVPSLRYMEDWFESELSPLIGCDYFEREFDRESGFGVFDCGRFSVLSGRLESLSTSGGASLGRFLGFQSDIRIEKKRGRDEYGEGSLYNVVKGKFNLPQEDLESIYSSRFCRHFYSGAEVEEFKRRWGK